MRYVLNGPLKEYRNVRRTDKIKTKLAGTKQSIQTRCNGTNISFETIVLKLILR